MGASRKKKWVHDERGAHEIKKKLHGRLKKNDGQRPFFRKSIFLRP